MIEVEGPDGVVHEFPDGTSDQTIMHIMRSMYPHDQSYVSATEIAAQIGLAALGIAIVFILLRLLYVGSFRNPESNRWRRGFTRLASVMCIAAFVGTFAINAPNLGGFTSEAFVFSVGPPLLLSCIFVLVDFIFSGFRQGPTD